MGESEIVDFYADQTVFITGGTGFLGKILVEKILRTCSIRKMYLLVRPKKGKSVEERFNEFFDYACFQNIQDRLDEFKEKIEIVHGDCEKEKLGIPPETEELLTKTTSIVIHAAANVKFDQPLRMAANTNVRSTIDVFNLAKKMPNLKAFVFVSTAFSNCTFQRIEEKFYPPPMTVKELFSLLRGVPDDTILDQITPKILKNWPNTYTFTKAIAEGYLESAGKGLPVAVNRPAIVTSAAKEPIPGWIDNFYGVVGITIAAALGALRSLNANPHSLSHLTPVDYVVNSILAATWKIAKEKRTEPLIFTNAPENNPLTWHQYMKLIEGCAWDYPSVKVIWYYSFELRENLVWHKICRFFSSVVMVHIVDLAHFCLGRQPTAVKNYNRLDKMVSLLKYFLTKEWTFATGNTNRIWNEMTAKDQELFPFNMDELDWKSYIVDSVIGARVYLLKDPLETIPEGIKKIRKIAFIHYASLAIIYFLCYKFLRFLWSLVW